MSGRPGRDAGRAATPALVRFEVYVRFEVDGEPFRTIVNWGRHAELFGYDSKTRELYLDAPANEAPLPLEATFREPEH